jgi:hypothetical protein
VRVTKTDAGSTVEERRFSAALIALKETGFSRWGTLDDGQN